MEKAVSVISFSFPHKTSNLLLKSLDLINASCMKVSVKRYRFCLSDLRLCLIRLTSFRQNKDPCCFSLGYDFVIYASSTVREKEFHSIWKISGLFCDVFISISPFRKYVYQLMALSIAETIKK